MEQQLQNDGWFLSEKGFSFCKNVCASDTPSKNDIIRHALHSDIRSIGRQILPADINKGKIAEISGPMVLQIQKIKNISAPNAKEDSSVAPRMLRILLTDGVINCTAIEIEPIQAISLSTPPGTKICLKGNTSLEHGFLLLDSNSVKFLGGEVEHLVSKWEISQNVSKLQRKVLTAEGGPPLFVPYDENSFANRKPQSSSSVKIKESTPKTTQTTKAPFRQQEGQKPAEQKKIWKSEEKYPRKKWDHERTEISAREGKVKTEEQSKPSAKRSQNKKAEDKPVENDRKFSRSKDTFQVTSHDHGKRDLPPRLERLRHNQKDERHQHTYETGQKQHKMSSTGSSSDFKEAKLDKKKDDKFVDKDIEQVVDLIDRRMRMDDEKEARNVRDEQKTRFNYDKDRNYNRNFDRNQKDFYSRGRGRNDRYQDSRDRGPSSSEKRQDGARGRGRNDQSDWNRERANRSYKKANSKQEVNRQASTDSSNMKSGAQHNGAGKNSDPVEEQLSRDNHSANRNSEPNGVQMKNEPNNDTTYERHNPKVAQFISEAATANPGFLPVAVGQTGGYLVEDPNDVAIKQTTMQNPIFKQPSMQQSNIQRFPQTTYSHQQLLPSSAPMIYMPSYHQSDVYHNNFTQAYHMAPNPEYQQVTAQRFQAPMHAISQYQQPPGSAIYLQNPAVPNQVLHQQNYSFRGPTRPRVRHDIYRPKH